MAPVNPNRERTAAAALFASNPLHHVWLDDIIGGTEITTYGGDIVYETLEAFENQFEYLHCLHSRDGSFSSNGFDGTVSHSEFGYGCGSGLGLTATGYTARDIVAHHCNRGVFLVAGAGNFGRRVTLDNVRTFDNRISGIDIGRELYREHVVGHGYYPSSNGYPSRTRYVATNEAGDGVWRIATSTTGQALWGPNPLLISKETPVAGDGGYLYHAPPAGADLSTWWWELDGTHGTALAPSSWTYINEATSLRPQENVLLRPTSERNGKLGWVDADKVHNQDYVVTAGSVVQRYGAYPLPDGIVPAIGAPQASVLATKAPLLGTLNGAGSVALTTDQEAPNALNQLVLQTGQGGIITGTIGVKRGESQDFKGWRFEVAVRRTSAVAMAFVSAPVITPVPGWSTGLAALDALVPSITIDLPNFAVRFAGPGLADGSNYWKVADFAVNVFAIAELIPPPPTDVSEEA